MLGRERSFRRKLIDLARLKVGDSVLDVGCGTGTVAIVAKERVGQSGRVFGIDASPEMIDRAARKARRAGIEIDFRNERVEAMPFEDAQFNAVLSTLMLHHLPRKVREQAIREMRRVLKPGGRVLIVDFGGTEQQRGLLAHLHRRHGHVNSTEIAALLNAAGLNVIDAGAVGTRDLHFALGGAPCCNG